MTMSHTSCKTRDMANVARFLRRIFGLSGTGETSKNRAYYSGSFTMSTAVRLRLAGDVDVDVVLGSRIQDREAMLRVVRLLKRWRGEQASGPVILRPPGVKLLSVAEFLFSATTFREVLEPTLRDLQEEHIEALASGRVGKAGWVRLRGYFSFWSAVIALAPVSLIKRLTELWKVLP